jgi:hypothetical protein
MEVELWSPLKLLASQALIWDEAPHWRLKYGVQAQNHDPR